MISLLSGALLCAAVLLAGVARGAPPARSAAGSAPCSLTRQLAYVAANFPGKKAMVWLAAPNGSGRRRLFQAATPALAPSGRLIAVTQFSGSAGLGIFTVCGSRLGQYFSSRDAISGIVWSPDSSLVAAIVKPHPNGSGTSELVVFDVATGQLTTVATGYDFSGPSFSPTAPYSLTYAVAPTAEGGPNVWSAAIGQTSTQLTQASINYKPLWGPQGILYQHDSSSSSELELLSNGHSTRLMNLSSWPVALSSDGLHLVAENVACGAVFASSVNLATRKVVHQSRLASPPSASPPRAVRCCSPERYRAAIAAS